MNLKATSRLDLTLEQIRIFIKSGRLPTALWSFLIGLLTRIISDPSVKRPADFFRAALWTDSLSVRLCWFVTAALAVLPGLRWLLEQHRKRRGYDALLADLLTKRMDPSISPFAKGVIAVGSSLTLQLAPDLREGWNLSDVEVRYSGRTFELPPRFREPYDSYVRENRDTKRLFDDRPKFMLIRNPASFSDSPTLVLELTKTKYSEVQFYRDCVATVQSQRDSLIAGAVKDGNILFPHSLCMQAVVVTDDNQVLLTQRSHKVAYYPGTWSSSLEEQLAEADLASGNEQAVLRWAKRFLREELSIHDQHYHDANLRALAVFLEADCLNCSLDVVFKVSLTARELEEIIKGQPRSDYEFQDWRFVKDRELASEVLRPTRQQHPTSPYRSLLFLANKWGAPRLAEALFRPAG